MAFYSWQLTLLVWACFVPLFLILRPAQGRVNGAYTALRERVGAMLGAISESVVGAETIRAYGVGGAHRAPHRTPRSRARARRMVRAQVLVSTVFSSGVLVANLVLAVVVVVGTLLGIDGSITAGQLLAFLFLVQLFTGSGADGDRDPQRAAERRRGLAPRAGRRRDAGPGGRQGRPGRAPAAWPRARAAARTSASPTRTDPRCCTGWTSTSRPRTSVAVVGATGSGKTTIAKLVTRLMDPTAGAVRLDGVDLRDLSAASLRERVVLVPQEGFLFDGTLAENIAYGVRDASAGAPGTADEAGTGETPAQTAARHADRIDSAVAELGLTDWVADLPDGLATAVGQRGEALSAGERQLVAIARAYLAEADLLVLDEATSAVDPATEVRIARALDSLTAGRSTITIAHRLSTAEAADLVVVVDAGHVVEVGPHAELAVAGGVYASMHASWVAQTR